MAGGHRRGGQRPGARDGSQTASRNWQPRGRQVRGSPSRPPPGPRVPRFWTLSCSGPTSLFLRPFWWASSPASASPAPPARRLSAPTRRQHRPGRQSPAGPAGPAVLSSLHSLPDPHAHRKLRRLAFRLAELGGRCQLRTSRPIRMQHEGFQRRRRSSALHSGAPPHCHV